MFLFCNCRPVFPRRQKQGVGMNNCKTWFAYLVVLMRIWTTVQEFQMCMKVRASDFLKQAPTAAILPLFISSWRGA